MPLAPQVGCGIMIMVASVGDDQSDDPAGSALARPVCDQIRRPGVYEIPPSAAALAPTVILRQISPGPLASDRPAEPERL